MAQLPLRYLTVPLPPRFLLRSVESACSVPVKSLVLLTASPCGETAFSHLERGCLHAGAMASDWVERDLSHLEAGWL